MSRPDAKGNKPEPGDWGSAAVDPEPDPEPDAKTAPAPAPVEETVTVEPVKSK